MIHTLDESLDEARSVIMRRGDVMRRLHRADEQWLAACRELRDTPEADQTDDQRWNVIAGLFRVADLADQVKAFNAEMRPALRALGLMETDDAHR